MKEITDTCIIEKGLPEKKYYYTDYLSAGARLYEAISYNDLGKDFFHIDFKGLSLVELFEIDESLQFVLNKNTKITDLENVLDVNLDKKTFNILKPKVEKIPDLYPTPFEWDCFIIGYDHDMKLTKVDIKNELLVYSLVNNNKHYIFYVSVYDFNCVCNYDRYQFYEKDIINAKESISRDLEIKEEEIEEEEIHISVFSNNDDVYFFMTAEQENKIYDYYFNKFILLKEIFEKLHPNLKQVINSKISLSK